MASSTGFAQAALISALVATCATGAQALTVTRCNVNVEGVFRPALKIKGETETSTVVIGQNGLTRRIIFNQDALEAWVEERFGASMVFSDCAYTRDPSPSIAVPAAAPPPPAAAPTGSCGPCGGCGPSA
jgi:hypothetical protein